MAIGRAHRAERIVVSPARLPAAAHGLLDVGVMSYIGAPDLVIVATDSNTWTIHARRARCGESRGATTSRDEKIAA